MRKLFGVALALVLLTAAAAQAAMARPVLAGPWTTNQKGYGHTKPRTIFNGGDPSGLINHIRWASWGKPHAVGFGIGLWVRPHQATLNGHRQPAKIVLFQLGRCHGHRAYNAIEWYFPQHHQRFTPGTYINACTGTYYQRGHPFALRGSSARARFRWPVLGCDQLSLSYTNHYERKYKPSGLCQTGGRLGTTTGITGAHWKHWGRARATAYGYLIDGLGFDYPAKITAYHLQHTDHLDGIAGDFASWYARLHVAAKAEVRGGVKRGPYRIILNTVPGG